MAGPTLFRPSDIATGLQGYWPLSAGENLGNATRSGTPTIVTAQYDSRITDSTSSGLFAGGNHLTFADSRRRTCSCWS